ncbi:ParB/RepB/Spo0J family partition protein [Rapidithrix thailandica]|uniref:ParB/RepB/Spo0J family partition protein n=1 Tax=Rapidithrix thailandica TaxID=413964 RepID=A0AAW9SDV8_9BACT
MAKKILKKRQALGKGLSALLSDSPSSNNREETNDSPSLGSISEIALSVIEVNPFQPRKEFDRESLQELADSISTQGVIQPITVRQLETGRYQLISGERRLQAARIANLETLPAYIRTANDQQMLEMALIENIQREDLNSIEIALSYQRLVTECNLKQEELGKRVGKNRTTVNNYMRLLKLPPEIQKGLQEKKIDMGHARPLVNLENIEQQLYIYQRIVNEKLSVREVEKLVKQLSNKQEPTPKTVDSNIPTHEITRLQADLSTHFGTKIKVNTLGKEKGEIKIPFHSVSELNRILDIIKNE